MNRQSVKKALIFPYIIMMVLALALLVLSFLNSIFWAIIATVITVVLFAASVYFIRTSFAKLDLYIGSLAGRITKSKTSAVSDLPIGVILLDKNYNIEWINNFISRRLERDVLNEPINEIFPNILKRLENTQEVEIEEGSYKYKVTYTENEKSIYLFDITETSRVYELYENEKPIIATIFLDNYDEITQNMNDSQRSEVNSLITNVINDWSTRYELYVKRYSSDQFIGLLNNSILEDIEASKFNLLDDLRDKTREIGHPLTLSIGIGEGSENLIELGELSQSSLDLALGRGGDQVAIKNFNGNVRFYGGKTDPMEKRTRVRARVISHALRDILIEGDKVIIMGHKSPDMDAIGAAIGVSRIAKMNNLESYIVLNDSDIDDTLQRVMREIDEKPDLKERFITSEEAWHEMTSRTTLVVVDTHKPELVIDENLLNKANRKVVIDHHRRGESIISSPLLVYMEPYASSTAELVTELLEYQPTEHRLTRIESTIMLAGIIVDTRNFTLRTGSRTFDAASFLRSHGADTILCQHFLKDDIDTYIKRSDLIKTVKLFRGGVAIAHGDEEQIYHPVTVAQAADELLGLEGVEASYVVAKRSEDTVGISARSLGEVNVQLTMEALGGGGHLSNAATQIKDSTVEEAIEKLIEVVETDEEGVEE
ncbi:MULTISPECIES: DHH family phosphoesterase [Mammaliicoccus]|jgi:c-di-AMP phosphodiesterase-like protein|uniref:Cyclic-di-AMP phosphodiesterase n=1 Tax=Mammaliicoccus lentus TaxID=42858 RepID=A0ABS6GYM5_MAMLE|nr:MULTISPECIES: DHH family phosphoesterase [Mammaliicoccus]MBF0840615.1 DHH family phosphoesterase [Mammaliicoccus lentus]MBU6113613.1 DHH family phosphoesterase [Mammaliicoccus lentus]MBW0768925.1 DHH family phosphoesterase [Mammaliicoccus lentus]MCD2476770.1 DHH family phosphoesterase [Mammaliicoccus lentus]MCD2519980.1 DHH family phosphoesterase [Mammaliicoccus lentus]